MAQRVVRRAPGEIADVDLSAMSANSHLAVSASGRERLGSGSSERPRTLFGGGPDLYESRISAVRASRVVVRTFCAVESLKRSRQTSQTQSPSEKESESPMRDH